MRQHGQLYGFTWRNGRRWGVAHPEHNCWADPDCVAMSDVGIALKIHENALDKQHRYGVGYISTIETIKYGTLTVSYSLPHGKNLWPAIWLTDGRTWPPEIDIMEAWSGRRGYRRNLIRNEIFPSIHTGASPDTHKCLSYKTLGGTRRRLINTYGINECQLYWSPSMVEVKYNGHTVMCERRPDILRWLNASAGMEIHLNNYVTGKFSGDTVGHGCFFIHNLTYRPL